MENVITLGKLIRLLLFCLPSSLFFLKNPENTRNELACPVMVTIFLVLDLQLVDAHLGYMHDNVMLSVVLCVLFFSAQG